MSTNRIIDLTNQINARLERRRVRYEELCEIDRWSTLVNILRQTVLVHHGEVQDLENEGLRQRIVEEEIRLDLLESQLQSASEELASARELGEDQLRENLLSRVFPPSTDLDGWTLDQLAVAWVNFQAEAPPTVTYARPTRERIVYTVGGTDSQWENASPRRRVTDRGKESIDPLFLQIAPQGIIAWEYQSRDGRIVISSGHQLWEIRADAVNYYLREVAE